jgi:N-acetylmuramoyl-L-alanine amidase
VALALVGCAGGDGDDASERTTTAPTTSTTTSTATTLLPPTTTRPVPTVPASGPARALVTPTGVVAPVLGGGPGAWQVRTPCGRTATVAGGMPVPGAVVVLDPGHGGVEPGAVGPNGLAEKELNLLVTQHTQAALEANGVNVLLTRTADYRITLRSRAEIATTVKPAAFVSIHHNGDPDGPRDGPGTETYYQIGSPASKRLAGLIYEEVVAALSAYEAPWVADTDAGAKYRLNDEGGDYYGILRHSAGVPSVLAELAFVNAAEADLLARPDVQRAEGEAVARGIVRFLTTDDPGSGYVTPYPRETPAGGGGGAQGCVDPPLS